MYLFTWHERCWKSYTLNKQNKWKHMKRWCYLPSVRRMIRSHDILFRVNAVRRSFIDGPWVKLRWGGARARRTTRPLNPVSRWRVTEWSRRWSRRWIRSVCLTIQGESKFTAGDGGGLSGQLVHVVLRSARVPRQCRLGCRWSEHLEPRRSVTFSLTTFCHVSHTSADTPASAPAQRVHSISFVFYSCFFPLFNCGKLSSK